MFLVPVREAETMGYFVRRFMLGLLKLLIFGPDTPFWASVGRVRDFDFC